MNVIEIFNSIEGEGIRQGFLATFIRLEGCNLRCSYCDSEYSFQGGQNMTIQEIVKAVQEFSTKKVTITGGEPLLHDLEELCKELDGYDINIETNGSLPVKDLGPNVFYTMDYKAPSSGMEHAMRKGKHIKNLRPCDVLKFVVENKEDLQKMTSILQDYKPNCTVYVSPVFGKIAPVDIVEFMKKNQLDGVRIQLQIHKFIWNPEEKGV